MHIFLWNHWTQYGKDSTKVCGKVKPKRGDTAWKPDFSLSGRIRLTGIDFDVKVDNIERRYKLGDVYR